MPSFSYRAVDSKGATQNGRMTVSDEHALEVLLSEKGLYLIQVKEMQSGQKKDAGKSAGGKVKRADLIEFCTGMLPMLSSGIPLIECLEGMIEEVQNPAMGDALQRAKDNIEAGNSLSDAMLLQPKVFPSAMINLIKAGEYSGNLNVSFSELRDYYMWLEKLHSEIKQATIYPSMVILAAFAFIMLLFTFVVPRFTKLLIGFGVELPVPTQIVMGIADFMSSNWYIVFSIPVLIWLLIKMGHKHSEKFSLQFEKIKYSIPLFGDLNLMIALSRMSKNMGIMYRSGIPILESIDFCRDLVGSKTIAKAMGEIKQDISDGSTIANAYRQHSIFPPMVIRMIAVGESTGNLDETLGYVSAHYDEELPRRIKRLFAIIEPMIILGLIGVVGFVALSIFMPMLSMMSAI